MRKRKDRNRQDKTTGQKITGTIKAASATIAGVAFLRNTETAHRLVSEVFPAVRKTYRKASQELYEQNRKVKASDIERAFSKAIGKNGDNFKKELTRARKTKSLDEFAKDNDLFSKNRSRGLAGVLFDKARVSNKGYLKNKAIIEKENELKRTLQKNIAIAYNGKYSEDQIHQIVDSMYGRIEKATTGEFIKNDLTKPIFNHKYNKEFFDHLGIEQNDRDVILRHIYNEKFQIKSASQDVNITDAEKKLKTILSKKEVIRSQTDNYIYNRIDRFLGKFGLDVDSEQYLTGSKALRLKDLTKEDIEQLKKVNLTGEKGVNVNLGEQVEDLLSDKDLYGDLILDKSLRKRTNLLGQTEIFSSEYMDTFLEEKRKSFSSTIVGKVLYAGIDFENQMTKPFDFMIHSNKISSFAKNTLLEDSYLYLNGKAYRFFEGAAGFDLEEGFETNIVSTRHGKAARIIRNTFGTTRINPNNSDNELLRQLDIGQNGKASIFKNVLDNIFGNENEINEHDVADRIKYTIKNYDYIKQRKVGSKYSADNPSQIYEDFIALRDMLDYHVTKNYIDDATYRVIRDDIKSDELQEIFDGINNDDLSIDDIFDLIERNKNSLKKDGKLKSLLNMYDSDPNRAYNYLSIDANPENTMPILDMPLNVTNVSGPRQALKKAAVEEYISRNQSLIDGNFYAAFDNLDLNERQMDAIDSLGLKVYLDNAIREVGDDASSIYGYDSLFKKLRNINDSSGYRINNVISHVEEDFNIFNKGSIVKRNAYFENDEYNAYDLVQKSALTETIQNAFDMFTNPNSGITGKDLIEGINNSIKELTIGGKNHKEHFSALTMLSQYSLQRLSMGVEEVGLGLSSNSMASPLDTFKNIALRRVLPAMLAYNTLDYLNFESRNLTGVSLVGAAANTVSNIDLAARNIADHTGVGFLYDQFKNTSVIAEYLTGSTDYQNRDEREEWYRTGESVVRKARFWSFGSSSEFRGTSISYYQPNYLRRAHSNWKEVGIYGDPDEKWAHSPLPSLRHPLSPIRFLLDPYWLEKKNFDERPYPLTAKMFSEGTPWGAILNPTVGQLLKPVRMLPQARRRLKHGRVGEDINNVLYRINERTKNKKDKDDDMVIIRGTDIRNAQYVPFGNPTSEEYNLQNNSIQGLDYMDTTTEVGTYSAPSGEVYNESSSPFSTFIQTNIYTSRLGKKINDFTDELFKGSTEGNIGQALISNINKAIKGEKAFIRYQDNMPDDGVYIYRNLVRDKQKADSQYYENKANPKRIDRSIGLDFARDAKYSVKQLSGIYGFIGDTLFGSDYKQFRYENAGQMTSFSRGFWDASIGGLGGGLMEISRRFFPSTNKDIVNVNPLRNSMASWLPDSYRMGDPFVKIPKGEMRLPGRGYETLNELHPDQFATDGYGAFDRFKILADVAPYSDEYKIWSGIAKRTVTDPELVSEMEEIEKRVAKKSGDHEFFEYRYINNGTEVQKGVVKSVGNDGTLTLQNGLKLTMAGLKPVKNAQTNESIYNYLKPGDKITYRTTENAIKNLDDMTEMTKAIIYKEDATLFSSRNISKELIDAGIMEYDEEDNTPIAALAKTGTIGENLGAIQEIIAHAPIPFIHNKFLKVESSLESFKNEQVYGSNFQTWDHPIEGFVKPALNKSFYQSMVHRGLATGYGVYHFSKVLAQKNNKKSFLSGAVLSTLDPTAFLFGSMNWATRMGDGFFNTGKYDKHKGNAKGAFSRGAKVGSIVSTIGWGIANAKNPFIAASSFGLAAAGVSEYLEDTAEVLERRLPKKILDSKLFNGNVTTAKLAGAGAIIGLGVSAVRNITSPEEKMFGPWVPKKTRKKYELDEYFDRLSYLKYEGLYKKAARKAAIHEKSPIGIIFKEIDKNKKKVGKLKKKALELSNKHMVGSYEYNEKMKDIQNKIASLEERQSIAFHAGGKYTKAAIAYKKASESTIYGLNEGSSRDEIMAAVPNQYKDHFMAFMNETSDKKRKEILSYMPKYLQKPLQVAWGQDYEVRSNARYFRKKKLPNMAWKGWKPNVNMDHVKMKTIESEGMLLSDFGYYESEKSKAQYEKADAIRQRNHGSGIIGVRGKLLSIMQGMGMPLTNVSVEETSSPGISIFGDFQQQVQDVASLATYI